MATLAWAPALILAAQQRRPAGGGVVPNRPQGSDIEPDWIVSIVEQYWVGPCSAKLPEIMHGMCIVVPAMVVCICLVLAVVLLKWCSERKVTAVKSATKKNE